MSQGLTCTSGVDHVSQRRELTLSLVAVDIIALIIALLAAGLLRTRIDSLLPVASLGWVDRHVLASLVAIPVLILVFWRQGRYDPDTSLVGTRDYAQIAHGLTYGMIIALAISYFSGGEPLVSRSWLLLVWAMSILCVGVMRFAVRRVIRYLRLRGWFHTRVVIVGASSLAVALAEQLRASRGEGIEIVGFLDEYLPIGQLLLHGVAVIGRPLELVEQQRDSSIDEYVLVPQALPHERMEEITRLMVSRDGPVLRMAVSSRDLLTHGVRVTERGRVPLVRLQRARLQGLDALLKRLMDVIGALLALALVGPIALAALAWSYISGNRSLLAPELICAPGGETTKLWLLAEEVSSRLAVRGAPALLAVLSGELSLVGPRPMLSDSRPMTANLWATAVAPGLTGPWRLSGPQASLEDQNLEDLAYVRNYSIWEDIRILWQSTRPGALLGRWRVGNSRVVTSHSQTARLSA